MKIDIKIFMVIITLLFFVLGIFVGATFTYGIISSSIIDIASTLRIEKVEIGFNESYIMDRFDKIINSTLKERKTE